jgi:dTDP-glucose 4,6-dehydratase
MHVDDHCRAIAMLALLGVPGETYNIGTGEYLSNLDVARILLGSFSKSMDWIDFVPDRPGHDFRYALDASKIEKMGFRPQIEFRQGILETVNWYRKNRSWWKGNSENRFDS